MAPEGMACCAKSHDEPSILPQCCQMQAPSQAPDRAPATPAQIRGHDARPSLQVTTVELAAPASPLPHRPLELTDPGPPADRLHIRLGVIRR
jgi:hypothetical protein